MRGASVLGYTLLSVRGSGRWKKRGKKDKVIERKEIQEVDEAQTPQN